MHDNLNKLIILASSVRNIIEDLSETSLGYKSDLGGYCGIASKYLVDLARKDFIRPTFVFGYFTEGNNSLFDHCWVEHYGKIIDITASQFRTTQREKVFITEKSSYLYKKEKSGKEAEDYFLTWKHPHKYSVALDIIRANASKNNV